MCFPLNSDSSLYQSLFLSEHYCIILVGFFCVCNPLPCSSKDGYNIWLYLTHGIRVERGGGGQNQQLDAEHTQLHGQLLYSKCHQGQSQEVMALGTILLRVKDESTTLSARALWIKLIIILSVNHVVKI